MTRFGYVKATCFAAMCVAAAAIVPTSLKLVWNVSASAPIGVSPYGSLPMYAMALPT